MLSFYKKLENDIVHSLTKGPVPTRSLIKKLAEERRVTEQGVYKALRFLIDQEVVTKGERTIGLSAAWIERLVSFTEQVTQNYVSSELNDPMRLKEGEKMRYSFSEYTRFDTHWLHVFLLLMKKTGAPAFFLYPHMWFSIPRKEASSILYEWSKRNQRFLFRVNTGSTDLDKDIRKRLENEQVQISSNPSLTASVTKYSVAIADFLLSFDIPEQMARDIENIYEKNANIDSAQKDFKHLIQQPWKIRLTVEKNSKKALLFRRRVAKDFYISPEIRQLWL
jgi:hypothetical protein